MTEPTPEPGSHLYPELIQAALEELQHEVGFWHYDIPLRPRGRKQEESRQMLRIYQTALALAELGRDAVDDPHPPSGLEAHMDSAELEAMGYEDGDPIATLPALTGPYHMRAQYATAPPPRGSLLERLRKAWLVLTGRSVAIPRSELPRWTEWSPGVEIDDTGEEP